VREATAVLGRAEKAAREVDPFGIKPRQRCDAYLGLK
jgi:hypothetical protein